MKKIAQNPFLKWKISIHNCNIGFNRYSTASRILKLNYSNIESNRFSNFIGSTKHTRIRTVHWLNPKSQSQYLSSCSSVHWLSLTVECFKFIRWKSMIKLNFCRHCTAVLLYSGRHGRCRSTTRSQLRNGSRPVLRTSLIKGSIRGVLRCNFHHLYFLSPFCITRIDRLTTIIILNFVAFVAFCTAGLLMETTNVLPEKWRLETLWNWSLPIWIVFFVHDREKGLSSCLLSHL